MSEFEDKLQSILGDPEAMGQIMSLAQSITGNSQSSDSGSADDEMPASSFPDSPPSGDFFSLLGDVDPRWLQLGMRLLSEYRSGDEEKTALLNALHPFLREERYAKLDKAIRLAKLSHVIRLALDSFRKGDTGLV